MNIETHPTSDTANTAAADCLSGWLTTPATRNVMVAAGNTPIELYKCISGRGLDLSHLNLFALDEYVGVPPDEPRNCANLLRRTVGEAWGIRPARFHIISPLEQDALASVLEHERRILDAGGLDVLVLGLGQNGHLGFNEPGSAEDSAARVLNLHPTSVEANRQWFHGDYAPSRGATVGMKTLLAARRVMILAYGPHKTAAVRAMTVGPRTPDCPASLLQGHACVWVFLDAGAAVPSKRTR